MSAVATKRRRARRQIERVHERRRLLALPPFTDEQAERQIIEARRRARAVRRWGILTRDLGTVETMRRL